MTMLRPVLKAAPSAKPVTVDEVKANSRIVGTSDDALVGALIDSAITHLDGWSGVLGRCLINQTWVAKFDAWPSGHIALPFPDVSAVVISYVDASGQDQTVNGVNYRLIETACGAAVEWVPGFSLPSLSTRSDAISIELMAGYGATASNVPDAIKRAIIMLASHWYENREATIVGVSAEELPMAVSMLIAPFRRIGI